MGKVLVDGHKVFKLMDTKGLPLEIITLELRQKGLGFNVPEFVDEALKTGNYTLDTIRNKLLSCLPKQYQEDFNREFKKLGGNG